MTYNTGGTIQAQDYNAFTTLSGNVNEVYGDAFPGATTIAAGANYGYGQTSIGLGSVTVGSTVTATQWANLFSVMRDCGTHQGTTVSPPVPTSGPVSGNTITAFVAPATISSVISTLHTNRMNLAAGQTSTFVGTAYSNPSAWTNTLTYTFKVDFGSWNNARYYFNSGGKISITGSVNSPSNADEVAWQTWMSTNFPVNLSWNTTTAGGNDVANPAGFYLSSPFPGLTTTYQEIFRRHVAGGTYSTNFGTVEAKLSSAAGTDGQIEFRVTLYDNDLFIASKSANKITWTVNRIQSAGVISYPGSYSYTNGGFTVT